MVGAQNDRSLRIAAYPWYADNPYQRLFYEALAPAGIEVVRDVYWSVEGVRRHAAEFDALHLHWPDARWKNLGWGVAGRARGMFDAVRALRVARSLGKLRMWTVHNLESHEGAGWLDRRVHRAIADECDLLIVHSQWGADEIRRAWRPRADVIVMPHGNYAGVYPQPRPRDEVLSELGLDTSRPVVSCVGLMRSYKGLEYAAEAARQLRDDVQFVFAGSCHRGYQVDFLRQLAADSATVRLIERSLPEQQFADIIAASDAMLLPYTKITGSGALLAAWTLGTGVICSDLPYFRELGHDRPQAMKIVARCDAATLAQGVVEYLAIPRAERSAAAHAAADDYAWSRCVEPVKAALARWQRSHSGQSVA